MAHPDQIKEEHMFKEIHHISEVQVPSILDKKEIKFLSQPFGITVGCYLFMDSSTFDSPEALECRGIAFDENGHIVSRPLHKFFNVGEKEWLSPQKISQREIAGIYEKLDGSMIATAFVNGELLWRSKKSFGSDVVKLAKEFLTLPENKHIEAFATEIASQQMTAIFELTHPEARIVVAQPKPQMRLLHVRHNHTGQYVLLDKDHNVHDMVQRYNVPMVPLLSFNDVALALESLETMEDCEGYVIQFTNGDMVKAKCPWYIRLHRSVTFLRERDIALLALNEELDDVKASLVEAGIDLTEVENVEARLKAILIDFSDQIEAAYIAGKDLDRKTFAITNKPHPLFGMIMERYLGKEVPLIKWYIQNRLKEDFTLRSLTNDAVTEALEG